MRVAQRKILRLSGFRAGSARPGHTARDGNKGSEDRCRWKGEPTPAGALICPARPQDERFFGRYFDGVNISVAGIRIPEPECERPPDARHRAARTLPEGRRQTSGSGVFARLRFGLGVVFILTLKQSRNSLPSLDRCTARTLDKTRRRHVHPARTPAGIGCAVHALDPVLD